jgi:FkbM family methyltransferase
MSDLTIQDHLKTFEDQLFVTETKVGNMVVYKNDTIVSNSLTLYGEYAEAEIEILSRYLDETSTYVDVGTNVGYHAIAINKKAGCPVIGFEPHPNHFVVSALNCNEKNIQLVHSAVGNKKGIIVLKNFDPAQEGNFGDLCAIDGGGVEVNLVKLDDVKLPACTVIKIDVEGYELEVLKGASKVIKQHRPVIMYEAIDIKDWEECHKFMTAKKYKQYWIAVKNKPVAPTFKETDIDPFNNTGVTNILCVPEEKEQPADLVEVTPGEQFADCLKRMMGYKLVF